MTQGNKTIRLSKVAREINVGISTIVEFLEDKGIKVESNPNTKINGEAYNLIQKEFNSEKDVKKESSKLKIKAAREKKESVSIKDSDTVGEIVKVKEEKKDSKVIKAKDSVSNPDKPKVVGKIDLNKKPAQKKSPEKKVNQENKKQQSKPTRSAEKKPVVEKKAERSAEIKEPVSEHKIKDEIKVVGKIDLSALNQKTRPAKKTKKQKEEERKARKEELKKKDGANKPKDNASDDAKKRKRKRINKEKVDINKKDGNNNDNRNNNNNNRPDRKKKKFNKQHKKPVVKQEVSDEDVQKQIKETLAKLTSKGKSKAVKHRRDKRSQVRSDIEKEAIKQAKEKSVLKLTEFVTVNELATMMSVSATDVISTCMTLGLFVSINQRLDAETLSIVAEEFDFKVEFISVEVQEAIKIEDDKADDLLQRAPIVTVMGHVDHGKTSLLDYIRKTNVIAGEAGGITQHIGAYNVTLESGKKITFLDTPGHEAFTAMRARGAQVTDVAIIIIAADDNVMPQTKEAINHASAAGVPIVFAINKIDKPGANADKIKEELASMNYLVEEWGGKYQSQDISAKNGLNIEELLEKVLLESEMLDLKANPNKKANGVVIESTLDKGKGYVTTLLVEGGTLKVGDYMLAGSYTGAVKAMYNERGQRIEEILPAEPVSILGLNGAPQSGDKFNVMESEKEAKEIANKRLQLQREQGLRTQKTLTLDEIGRRIAIGNFQELNIIIKGDVDGSIEALTDSLQKLSTDEIQVNIIHKAVGQISESDVMLATASDAIIVGFQVRPSLAARKLAENENVDIRLYSIIYDAIEEVKSAMEGMLSPEVKEEIVATVEVLETFKISKVGTIAGCMVRDGKINRNHKIRMIRDGIVIYTGELGSLKRFKDDVKEVNKGYECGLNIQNFNDIKVGDIVEAYHEVEYDRTL